MGALKGDAVAGVVRALAVVGSTLFVGGNFTSGSESGLAVYDLLGEKWATPAQALSGELHAYNTALAT